MRIADDDTVVARMRQAPGSALAIISATFNSHCHSSTCHGSVPGCHDVADDQAPAIYGCFCTGGSAYDANSRPISTSPVKPAARVSAMARSALIVQRGL